MRLRDDHLQRLSPGLPGLRRAGRARDFGCASGQDPSTAVLSSRKEYREAGGRRLFRRQNRGFPFRRKRIMVPPCFATGEVLLSIHIKGLGKAPAFGGRFDPVHLDAGGGPPSGLLRRHADRARP